jgi:DNA-binding GntR family transcriptional regulator
MARVINTAAGTPGPAERLRASILGGEMAAGQRLVEAELAEQFDASRAAVRAALAELSAEGLVERIPNKGARVRVVTVDEAIAVTECRMVLEGLCARKAAENVTDAEIVELREIGAAMAEAVKGGEPLRYSELNDRLHTSIRWIAAQPVAEDLLKRMNAQVVRHRFRLALRPGRPAQSLPQHLAMIDAIAARDSDAAEAATREHLLSVIEVLRESEYSEAVGYGLH